MLQNIKVDIIYYQTGTDFEMEFNLCGCCRMRLLTDKAEEPKNFVHLLARAVSRSRVIIACGPLFGTDGLIASVAKAIGKPLTAADNRAYNIRDEREIDIISGSMPLVTPDGVFGGCIIESGPQAIIMLSESRSVRKTIMTTLIHPYVEELSITPAPDGAHAAGSHAHDTAAAEPEQPAEAEAVTGETPAAEESEAATDEVPEAPAEVPEEQPAAEETVAEDAGETVEAPAAAEEAVIPEEPAVTDIQIPTVSEDVPAAPPQINLPKDPFVLTPEPAETGTTASFPEEENRAPGGYDIRPQTYPDREDPFPQAEEEEPPMRGSKLRIPILIVSAVMLICIAVLAYLLLYVPMRDGYAMSEYLREIFGVTESSALISLLPPR